MSRLIGRVGFLRLNAKNTKWHHNQSISLALTWQTAGSLPISLEATPQEADSTHLAQLYSALDILEVDTGITLAFTEGNLTTTAGDITNAKTVTIPAANALANGDELYKVSVGNATAPTTIALSLSVSGKKISLYDSVAPNAYKTFTSAKL